ncbi:aldehyde dehydrogenase, dimeric NADP-preferring-like isoform X2 [Watersipora subatra]|uniref:aldehyde dehydrogenase, dimeric NADP-preferring-like isoform X2 n=1 Tax=Watersipora subatra TaxID=2589382 RepID=UPI00355B0777
MANFNYGPMLEKMKEVFATGRTRDKSWREGQLRAIVKFLTEQKDALCTALYEDLRKDEFDSMVAEIGFCISEAEWFIRNLSELMKDKRKSLDMVNYLGGKAYIHYEPLGVILDIGAWNYPVQIIISSMISIIAAGNCVVLKPSEISSHTSKVLAELLPKYMDNECVKVVEGAVAETTALLKERWDHIVYTGSGMVGRIVYEAAAKHLTPVTLELGGKCPSYVASDCDMEAVCNRICWTKYMNAGQTCISVDYVLVDESVEETFIDQMIATVNEQFSLNPALSDSYGRIVSERQFDRLIGLMEASPNRQVRLGGESDKGSKFIAPTILTGITPNDRLMQEEIFGPILPVLRVKNHTEAIEFINKRDKPLHLNVFTKKQRIIDEFVQRTSSGGLSANDAMIFRVERGLPFGGVGPSGTGCYGGVEGFANFSHKKSVLQKSQGWEFLFKSMRYAPHTPDKIRKMKLTQDLPKILTKTCKWLAFLIPTFVLIGIAVYFGLTKGDDLAKKDL